MNPDTFEHDAEVIGLLQPFIDGELSPDEHRRVAEEIAANPEFQAFVDEQQRVQAALRELVPTLAPASLRARVLADLDRVDAERDQAERRGWFAPVLGRLRAFGKGTLLMMPAAAAAVVLFFVVRHADFEGLEGSVEGMHVDGGMASALVLPSQSRERASFPVQVAPARSLPSGVELVSDDGGEIDSSARVRYRDPAGVHILDFQRPLGLVDLQGTRQVFRGHAYYLDRDAGGRARVEFVLGPVHHSLALEGVGRPAAAIDVDEPDFRTLLELASALRQVHGQ